MDVLTDQYLIYSLVDPRNREPRYVGQSSRGAARPNEHKVSSVVSKGTTNPHFRNWVSKLLREGLVYEIVILERFYSAAPLNDAEAFWISTLRQQGYRLLNVKPGGRSSRGYTHSAEARERMRLAALGNKRCLGRKLSAVTRKKISEKTTGRIASPELCAIRSKNAQGENNSMFGKKRIYSTDTLKKMRESQRRRREKEKQNVGTDIRNDRGV